jgi:hypothetical protein
MASSSIGQPVVLNEETAGRLEEILSRPYVPAKSEPGEEPGLSRRGLDPEEFKWAQAPR